MFCFVTGGEEIEKEDYSVFGPTVFRFWDGRVLLYATLYIIYMCIHNCVDAMSGMIPLRSSLPLETMRKNKTKRNNNNI